MFDVYLIRFFQDVKKIMKRKWTKCEHLFKKVLEVNKMKDKNINIQNRIIIITNNMKLKNDKYEMNNRVKGSKINEMIETTLIYIPLP